MESVINELRAYHKRQGELLAAYPNANMTVKSKEEYDRNARLIAEFDALAAQPAPLADGELAALEALEKEATPAPWFAVFESDEDGTSCYLTPQASGVHGTSGNPNDFASFHFPDDATLAAAMRNALPGLLARVRAAEAAANERFWIPFTEASKPCWEDLVWAKNEAQEVEGCLFVDGEFHFNGGRVFAATHWMPRMIKPWAGLPVGTEQQLSYFSVKGGQPNV